MYRLNQINKLAKEIKKELNKNLVAVRVFSNCLLLYFDKGRVRFYSKKNKDWGNVGTVFFVTENFNVDKLSKTLRKRHTELIKWTTEYVESHCDIARLWLYLQYHIRYEA